MDVTVTIVMMIPVILAVALIINVIRKNLTEREAGDPVNITGVIPAVIVLVVAVMIIGSMGAAISPYSYDEESGELTINSDVGSGSQEWDSYGTDVKSLILNENVITVADGAFDTLTGLEYISISDSVESITSSAFGVTLKDYLDQTITDPEAGEYVGAGDGTLYYCDASIYTYSTDGKSITGLTSDAASAVNLVLPSKNGSTSVTAVGASAFTDKTTVERAFFLPDSTIESLGASVFKGTGLLSITLPDSITAIPTNLFQNCTDLTAVDGGAIVTINQNAFNGCTSLAGYVFPSTLTSVAYNSFFGCSSLTSLELPEGMTTIGPRAFQNCTGVTTIYIPASITQIDANAFSGCTGVTSVAVASGFSPETFEGTWAPSWTFYDSDGTTTIDKTVASNLAGATFQGTASALVKVLPDRSALTAEQTLQVQELTKKADLTLKLAETEISSVEEKELASA